MAAVAKVKARLSPGALPPASPAIALPSGGQAARVVVVDEDADDEFGDYSSAPPPALPPKGHAPFKMDMD